MQQRQREAAEKDARRAAQTGDAYDELLADGARYASKQDTRRAARACREAIPLRPDRPEAYFLLGASLANSGHDVEAAQRLLEAKERLPVGSKLWAEATARAFSMLAQEVCADVAKPEWWNDEGLKALSARVVRAAPNNLVGHQMRAVVVSGRSVALGRRRLARRRSSRRRPRIMIGLRRCAPCSGDDSPFHQARRLVPQPKVQLR